jgi:ABC-type transport system involved in multi-copper enzyme maturation permease subunit
MIFNLLRSDIYRLVRGRKFWVTMLMTVLITAGLYILMIVSIDQGMIDGSEMDPSDYAVASRTLPTHSGMLSLMGYGNGGVMPTVASVLAVLVVLEDFDTGYIKGLMTSRRARTGYYAERMLIVSLLTIWMSVVAIVSLEITSWAFGFHYQHGESPVAYFQYLAIVMLGAIAYALIVSALTLTVRNKAFGIAAALLVGTGMIGGTLMMAVQRFGERLPWLQTISHWLPVYNNTLYTDSASLFSIGGPGTNGLGLPVWLHVLICFAGWIALASGMTLLINHKRDMC